MDIKINRAKLYAVLAKYPALHDMWFQLNDMVLAATRQRFAVLHKRTHHAFDECEGGSNIYLKDPDDEVIAAEIASNIASKDNGLFTLLGLSTNAPTTIEELVAAYRAEWQLCYDRNTWRLLNQAVLSFAKGSDMQAELDDCITD